MVRLRQGLSEEVFSCQSGSSKDRKEARQEMPNATHTRRRLVPQLLDQGAYFIGGCCGTTPAHIGAFRQTIDAHLELKTD